MLYYFHADDIQVRLQVTGLEGAQMLTVGFFKVSNDGKHSTLEQFCPLSDIRFRDFEEIQRFWLFNPAQAWAEFAHAPGDIDWAFDRISEILHIVYKVNNLKAFL